ncbi:MAG: LPS export ABC transporter permease LptG, partial [Alphaproteobacteria bacterium]
MRLSNTLSAYLARQYVFWIGSVFFGLISVALVFDVVEMLRRGSGKQDASVGILVQMSFLKLPHLV